MTNYNERLDEVLSKTPCIQCDGSGAYPDYDGEPAQCQFCWQLRFTFIDKTKQSITSLIKDLVAEAKPPYKTDTRGATQNPDNAFYHTKKAQGYNEAIDQFEQNLLKALSNNGKAE